MSQQPPRDSYKALLWDYDYLLEKSDVECCYSLSEREVQIILAQIDYIAWKTRYKPTSTEIDLTTILEWQGNLARKLMSGCCPDEGLHRFDENGVYQTSTDGGETWVDDPENDPRNSAIAASPLPGTDSAAKQCAAADNVRDQFAGYRDELISILEGAPTLTAIIAGILAFLGVLMGVSGAAIGISVLLIGLANLLLSLTPASVAEQIDTVALNAFRCILYCNMQPNGTFTYENWQDILAQIAEEFTGFPETFFYQTVNAMGYIGLSNAGTMGAATAEDCGDCACALRLEPFSGFTFANLENRGGGWWRLTADDRPDDTWTMYVQRDGGGCFYIDEINVISGTDSPQCTSNNAPGYETAPCAGGGGIQCQPWVNSSPGCYYSIGYRALSPFVIDIHVTECP